MIRLCFLSPPGSGKGTICKKINETFDIKHFDVGQMLRDRNDESIKKVQAEGGLVDSKNVLSIFDEALNLDQFVLDGSPRKEAEAIYVLSHPNWLRDPGYLIKINTPKDVCIERLLKRGRFDDTPEAIEKRFDIFIMETMRSIELFREQGRLLEVDGNGTPDQIHDEIVQFLKMRMKTEETLKETIGNYHKGFVSEEYFDPDIFPELKE